MTTARSVLALVLVAALAAAAALAASDGSVGVCTRKDEFAKRLQAMDAKVAGATCAKDDASRKRLALALASAADADIECLSHIHFGLGDGPFRRPSKVAAGDVIEFDCHGRKVKGPVVRLAYASEGKGSRGWPLTAAICRAPDGSEVEVVFPEEDLQAELTWFQAYIKACRGWLNPQTWLPALVEKGAPPK